MDSTECRAAWPVECHLHLKQFWESAPSSFPRFEHLKDVLLYKHGASTGPFRGILFVQQRVSECGRMGKVEVLGGRRYLRFGGGRDWWGTKGVAMDSGKIMLSGLEGWEVWGMRRGVRDRVNISGRGVDNLQGAEERVSGM